MYLLLREGPKSISYSVIVLKKGIYDNLIGIKHGSIRETDASRLGKLIMLMCTT